MQYFTIIDRVIMAPAVFPIVWFCGLNNWSKYGLSTPRLQGRIGKQQYNKGSRDRRVSPSFSRAIDKIFAGTSVVEAVQEDCQRVCPVHNSSGRRSDAPNVCDRNTGLQQSHNLIHFYPIVSRSGCDSEQYFCKLHATKWSRKWLHWFSSVSHI